MRRTLIENGCKVFKTRKHYSIRDRNRLWEWPFNWIMNFTGCICPLQQHQTGPYSTYRFTSCKFIFYCQKNWHFLHRQINYLCQKSVSQEVCKCKETNIQHFRLRSQERIIIFLKKPGCLKLTFPWERRGNIYCLLYYDKYYRNVIG